MGGATFSSYRRLLSRLIRVCGWVRISLTARLDLIPLCADGRLFSAREPAVGGVSSCNEIRVKTAGRIGRMRDLTGRSAPQHCVAGLLLKIVVSSLSISPARASISFSIAGLSFSEAASYSYHRHQHSVARAFWRARSPSIVVRFEGCAMAILSPGPFAAKKRSEVPRFREASLQP